VKSAFVGVGEVRDEWEELARSTRAAPWLWPGWFEAWQPAFAPDARLTLGVLRDEDRVVALMPLLQTKGRLSAPANFHSPGYGFIAEDEASRRALAAAVLDAQPHALQFRQIATEGADAAVVSEVAGERGYRLAARVVERQPFARMDGDWGTFVARLDRHRRNEIARSRRRLSERGVVSVESVAPGEAELAGLLREGFAVESSGWKGREGTAIVSQPGTLAFYSNLAAWAAAEGWLRLGFLRLDGRAIAFEYMLEHGDSLFFLKGGYEEGFRSLGPGILLLHDLLATSSERGVRHVELLGGDEPYKLCWADGVRPLAMLAALAPTLGGRVEYAIRASLLALRGAARTARRAMRRSGHAAHSRG
jgi:CelD/BcsL family acetyltransferase involved in cellulose biosynthesis